ncbi:endonuclease [Siccirubricoccus deserti]|nr:endonuclease/exonuclease/phosphatase family protein [Siccirubricoccus deserti]GGC48655.1 endonuclease [Siccirubricoccus deserti]
MTYNVHSCRGTDGHLSPERIARVIGAARPDIVALQELDVGRARSGSLDQAEIIARSINMDFHFHPALRVEEERYGNAILTSLPLRLVKTGALPGLSRRPLLEPRGALWVAVDVGGGTELQVVTTHLGLRGDERLAQAEALLGTAWLGHPDCRTKPIVLLGDFNAPPRSRTYRRLAAQLRDVQGVPPGQRSVPTFPARWPLLRIDHIFLGQRVEAVRVEVRRGPLERLASDHLPLVADLVIRAGP